MKSDRQTEFGDFQTPLSLARRVCTLLRDRGVAADSVIEPTCGIGAFLLAAAESHPAATLHGWDVNPTHLTTAAQSVATAGIASRVTLQQQDFFSHDWKLLLQDLPGRLLVLGNPPWVTNSTVSSLGGSNLPQKRNFQGLRGLAARTGKANFDISEWMLIQLIDALRGRQATLAMLCKTTTARKVLRHFWTTESNISSAGLFRINAQEDFGAAVEACLFLVELGDPGPTEASLYSSLDALQPEHRLGLFGKNLVADLGLYHRWRHLEGLCPYQWRSGFKHDCAAVMEFKVTADGLRNKSGNVADLESDYVYPLLKCTELSKGVSTPHRAAIVPQRRVGEDTSGIANRAPQTWRYLQSHSAAFAARKSSIYADRAQFSVFGIGDYSYAPWKVAISGLHRVPRFTLVGPYQDRPVMFDDTCYFLPFQTEAEATAVTCILNSEPCQQLLASLIFPDSKRPITVDLLHRLNLAAIADAAGLTELWQLARNNAEVATKARSQMELVMEPRSDRIASSV